MSAEQSPLERAREDLVLIATTRPAAATAADLAPLVERLEIEAAADGRPSRFKATPAEVDVFLRMILAEATYLRYQQAIGGGAAGEAAKNVRAYSAPHYRYGYPSAARYFADLIDPLKGGGPYPSQLLCSQHNGFGPCPGAPWCTPTKGGSR